jgi:integrase
MYLDRRGNGYRFQIAVPADLQARVGKSPIRIQLGHVRVWTARRAARLLSGHAEKLFIAIRSSRGGKMEKDPRDLIIAELTAQLDALVDSFNQYKKSAEDLRESAASAARLEAENAHLREMGELSAFVGSIADGMQVLEGRVRSLPKRGQADAANALAVLQDQMAALAGKVQLSLEGGLPRPLLSQCLDDWTAIRRKTAVDKKKIDTDFNRISDFIKFAGDRPANKYRFFDFQRWSSLLTRVPSRLGTMPRFRGMTHAEAADYNDRLKEPTDRLTEKTIETNYLSPLKHFFRQIAAEHEFRSPLADADISISGEESVQRQPFSVDALNRWFAHAANEERADHKWLPLLGSITGARIAELINLQGRDLYQMRNKDGTAYWVLDLRYDLVAADGGRLKRKLKTKTARRLIAIHQIFVDAGFIAYAQSRGATDWLFPAAFYHGKERVVDPAGAASKRMNRMLEDVGIHKPLEQVFHSTRHSAKDFMRLAHVDRRTNNLQVGHALGDVSEYYGSKLLVKEEMQVLSVLPLPEGLDLDPYLKQYRR